MHKTSGQVDSPRLDHNTTQRPRYQAWLTGIENSSTWKINDFVIRTWEHGNFTSESESSSSMLSPSSVLRGLKPCLLNLLRPKMSPTFHCFPFPPAPVIMVPFPLFRHLLQAMQTASNKERATERAAASRTLEFTSVSTMKSKPWGRYYSLILVGREIGGININLSEGQTCPHWEMMKDQMLKV